MKSPKIASIPEATPETSFTERAKVAKKATKDKQQAVKISTSVHPDHVAYINKKALKLGKQRGKTVSTSEALRVLLDEHKEAGL